MSKTDANLEKAKYYWGYYRDGKQLDNLTAAAAFMRSYRELGGKEDKELEYLIKSEIDKVTGDDTGPVITKEGREWLARKHGIEGRGRTQKKAVADLEETERFIRIANK